MLYIFEVIKYNAVYIGNTISAIAAKNYLWWHNLNNDIHYLKLKMDILNNGDVNLKYA